MITYTSLPGTTVLNKKGTILAMDNQHMATIPITILAGDLGYYYQVIGFSLYFAAVNPPFPIPVYWILYSQAAYALMDPTTIVDNRAVISAALTPNFGTGRFNENTLNNASIGITANTDAPADDFGDVVYNLWYFKVPTS
jgi:hypothetical protein